MLVAFTRRAAVCMITVTLLGCATQSPMSEFGPQTAEGFRAATRVQDDPMSAQVVVTGPWVERGSDYSVVRASQTMLGAGIDRKTGKTFFLLSHRIVHRGGRWLFPRDAVYLDLDGSPKAASSFSRGRGEVEDCQRYSGCLYRESSSFALEESMIAAQLASRGSSPDSWRIRVNADAAKFDVDIPYQQLAGFYRAVTEERQRRFPALAAPSAGATQ